MRNGSIKAPRIEETCLASGIKEAPVWESVEPLKMRIAHLEEELAWMDQELRTQEKCLQSLQRELEAKVSQIDKLQDAIGYNSLGRSPPAPLRHSLAVEVHRRLKAKEGVSAEPTSRHFCHDHRVHHISTERQHIRKNSGTKKLINEAIMNNDFLKKLEPQHTREMVDCMYEKIYVAEQLVIQEGEPGNYLYVLAEGLFEVIQNGKLHGQMCPGTTFGELAILYNCKRTATVKAVTQSHIWALDRQTFQTIMMRSIQARHEEYFSFLLRYIHVTNICACITVEYFDKGEYIICEGEEGNTFFIIAKGEVCLSAVSIGDSGANGTPIFNQMVGTYEELQAYLSDERRNISPLYERSPEAAELRRLKEKAAGLSSNSFLKKLQVVATLGMGGFGRVKLKNAEDTAFALKCIKKNHIVDTRQQEHIYSEKDILQFKLYCQVRLMSIVLLSLFLLQACLSPPLYSMLQYGVSPRVFPKRSTQLEFLKGNISLGSEMIFLTADADLKFFLFYEYSKLKFFLDSPMSHCTVEVYFVPLFSHRWFQGFSWEGLRWRTLMSPLRRELKGPLDHSHFDMFPPELEELPDEFSGWDKDF
uniref:cGMP-dependent protein kinase n=1 Tax=Sinocyclocheilus grahami TaxID=75366 RepID=A0A672MY11_SINGR